MPSTVHDLPKVDPQQVSDFAGNNGFRDLVPADGNLRAVQDRRPETARLGIWVAFAAIIMSFAALTSALVVRQGSGIDWGHLVLPPILYLNTLLLLASSGTLEIARRSIAGSARGSSTQITIPVLWLLATLALGLLFVGGQYEAWRQLKAQGLYLATNPNSSFFYVFTGLHAVHVFGGLLGLLYVISKLYRSILRQSTFNAASQYWHFMGLLWLYLLFLLWIKL
ncbi:MAG TPA: cytochrome c oxidase subunit 3 [Candidatus Acidoferrum sp.]|nr:cytochrome c oxidase subunit 3 [Candidatus Acidoferrum sp.]